MYSFMNNNENGIAVHIDTTIGLDMINKKADWHLLTVVLQVICIS